jgi:hypothetical protein
MTKEPLADNDAVTHVIRKILSDRNGVTMAFRVAFAAEFSNVSLTQGFSTFFASRNILDLKKVPRNKIKKIHQR